MPDSYVEKILTARVYDVASESPLDPAAELSRRLGNKVFLKREDMQSVFSFKLRGAYNKLALMPRAELDRGVVCASAGNHAQGVALAAQRLNTHALIVMPITTPKIKIDGVAALGGEIVLHGEGYDDAFEHAQQLAEQRQMIFVHPFDDPDVIAGQGTIGMEILRQHSGKIDAIFVPVGGGGLAAGISAYVKYLQPQTQVIGVEPVDAPSMTAALAAGEPVTLEHVGTFADGVAVRRVGNETFRLCQEHLDEVVLVNTDEICAAIKDVFNDTRTLAEPAGAIAVAGLKKYLETHPQTGSTLVAIHSGANMNFDRLVHVAERANIGEHTEVLLAVEIPERPGSFRKFCEALGKRVVTEFNYRYSDPDVAHIFVGLRVGNGLEGKARILASLSEQGFTALDLSDNEMAKLHIRHMTGGRGPQSDNERLFRFKFPERLGALMDFLRAIGSRWNISLFHYRNHGSDYGRVFAGVQVPPADAEEFHAHLHDLGYAYSEETDNPACWMFLSPRG